MAPAHPNLFRYAHSELSQDAILCWLIAWADSAHATTDPALHALGRDFVATLFRATGIPSPEPIYSVALKPQFKHVDIVAEIGATHLLVIEDKVDSREHSDQLNTYAQALRAEYPDRQLALVFLKTGDQWSYAGVKADGWTTFLRRELIDLLRRAGPCSNAIYRDFLETLEEREVAVQRFVTAAVNDWRRGDPAYIGLFIALQAEFSDSRWAYVPNQSGGFLGFGWNFATLPSGKIYLQLQEDILVVKLKVDFTGRSDRDILRTYYRSFVVNDMTGFTKPRKSGSGATMTLAERGDYRVRGSDGRLDLRATIRSLREASAALSAMVANLPPLNS